MVAAVSWALRDRRSHSGHVGNTRRRRLITCCRLWPAAWHFLTRPPIIAHSAWMHGTLWNAIFTSLIAKKSMFSIRYVSIMMEIFYIDWQQHWKCDWTMNIGANRNAHANEQYQQNSHRWHTWDLGCFTVRRVFLTRLITRMKSFSFFFLFFFIYLFIYLFIFIIIIYLFFFLGGGGGAQLQCICYLVLYTDLKAAEGF